MKYFTLDHWIQDQELDTDNGDSNDAVRRYKAYLGNVADRLPADYVVMTKTVCLHDATMPELNVDVSGRRIIIRLDAGDFTMTESRKIRLHYAEVIHFSSNANSTKGLPGPHGFGQLGNDEIEVFENGVYEHRFLFSSGIELAIRFRGFKLEVL